MSQNMDKIRRLQAKIDDGTATECQRESYDGFQQDIEKNIKLPASLQKLLLKQ